jgi:hypothetical protein
MGWAGNPRGMQNMHWAILQTQTVLLHADMRRNMTCKLQNWSTSGVALDRRQIGSILLRLNGRKVITCKRIKVAPAHQTSQSLLAGILVLTGGHEMNLERYLATNRLADSQSGRNAHGIGAMMYRCLGIFLIER